MTQRLKRKATAAQRTVATALRDKVVGEDDNAFDNFIDEETYTSDIEIQSYHRNIT